MPLQTNYRNIYAQSIRNEPRELQRFTDEVNVHLGAIQSRPSGGQLLRELAEIGDRRNHKLTIHEMEPSRAGPRAQGVLSRHQLERHPNATSFSKINEIAEERYAIKTRNGPNEGSSALISWTAHQTSMGLDSDGDPTGPCASHADKVSLLAHELVHAKHMMAGTWKGNSGSPADPESPAGKEELRAVGLGKYKYSATGEPSENSVRAEHGLPKRKSYHHSGYRSD
ncbi:XopG/HopH/AvrPtoH family type III secretion system effector [Paracidovorax avenae]|uniref:XopG/HopH/AvrPtoH family type III secretion system effector n=1 Tax=Paracidovorax avenae TaxID=80867 RepID=UPI001651A331|nr:XopG/HopH/AvrPtoH family type III secretion system effector [Paracidovorax avenae]